MNNNLMSFKKSKSFLDGAISLAFLSFLICSVITLLLLLTDPFGGDYMYLTYKHYSSGTLNQIYNNVSYILAIIFGILAILHLSSFSVSCAALSQKSKELIHASFIIQLISLCIGIVALLLAIFFDYYKESYHIFFLYYLLPTILIFFNIISLLLLYKHWAFGRFYFVWKRQNKKKIWSKQWIFNPKPKQNPLVSRIS